MYLINKQADIGYEVDVGITDYIYDLRDSHNYYSFIPRRFLNRL